MDKFIETLYKDYGQIFAIEKLLFENKTEHQHLLIFQNKHFGRIMVLDGIIQTTEQDEFIYHEMLSHVPIIAHGKVKKVLIIGGGDGGMLREVVKHSSIEHITQVEIDLKVIEMSKEYLPNHSQGAFDDPRVNIVIDDGINFVKECKEKFDVIISDSTDPIGPGEVLFSKNFYESCKDCLTADGILVTQNGVAYMQLDEVKSTASKLKNCFSDWHFYSAAVPTYIGGIMTFAWATNNIDLRHTDIETLKKRFIESNIKTRYYNSEIHFSSFALPQYIVKAIGKQDNQYC